jgi:hypothetical protein
MYLISSLERARSLDRPPSPGPPTGSSCTPVVRLAGLSAAAAGGLLGYRQSAGASQAEPVRHLVEPGWHHLMTAAELAGLAGGQPATLVLDDVPVVVIRDDQGALRPRRQGQPPLGPAVRGRLPRRLPDLPVARQHLPGQRRHRRARARDRITAFRTRITGGVLQACLPRAG